MGECSESKATRILIVEDDQSLCLSMADMLYEMGFEVAVACDGEKALHELRNADPIPDLIILDLHMPNMNGWQLREFLKQHSRYCKIPVVIVSGDQACVDVQADGHLLKPFDLNDFKELVAVNTKNH